MSGDGLNIGYAAIASARLGAMETVSDFLDACDGDEYERERLLRPTLAEQLEDEDPEWEDRS